jgi:phosphoserine phosphatase
MLSRLASNQAEEIVAITNAGMAGEIPFRKSMEWRLEIAQPTREMVEGFGEEAIELLVPGMKELIAWLGAEAWIVSGGLEEALIPVGRELGIPRERIRGTVVDWADDGTMRGLARCGPKIEAVADVCDGWARPRIGVGDGMSDYALHQAGAVDNFIAFTGVVRREALVNTGCQEATTVDELEYCLRQLLQ